MRIALCNEVIRELPFERQCAFARAVGYDGLEIAPFTLSPEPHALPAGAPSRAAPGRRRCRHRHHRPALSDAGARGPVDHLRRRGPAHPHGRGDASALRSRRRPRRAHPRARLAGPAPARARPGGRGAQMGCRVLRRRRLGGRESRRRLLHRAAGCPEANYTSTRWRRRRPSCAPSPIPRCGPWSTAPPPPAPRRRRSPSCCGTGCPRGSSPTSTSTTPTAAARARAISPSPRSCARWPRRLCRHGGGRALHLRARRPRLRRPRHRLRAGLMEASHPSLPGARVSATGQRQKSQHRSCRTLPGQPLATVGFRETGCEWHSVN